MCCLWTYVVCSWRNWGALTDIVIDIEQVALAGVCVAAAGGVQIERNPALPTGPAGLGLLWWPRRSVLTATVHSFMSLYFYNLRINFISLLLQTIFIQHFHLSFVHFANTCFTLFIFLILFCLLVQRREMHEETACIPKAYCYAKVCTRLNHLGGQNWKKSLPWEGGQPPSHTFPPLGRYAPSGLVASLPSQSRNLFRNFFIWNVSGWLHISFSFIWYTGHSYWVRDGCSAIILYSLTKLSSSKFWVCAVVKGPANAIMQRKERQLGQKQFWHVKKKIAVQPSMVEYEWRIYQMKVE